jgi:hypothetical protein
MGRLDAKTLIETLSYGYASPNLSRLKHDYIRSRIWRRFVSYSSFEMRP